MHAEETRTVAGPDYVDLIKLLCLLRTLPDALGETTLTAEEAARIRSLGFTASFISAAARGSVQAGHACVLMALSIMDLPEDVEVAVREWFVCKTSSTE
jgi:hypothetical protein